MKERGDILKLASILMLFGSITRAAGCGSMFTRGYTTGGSDLLAWMLRTKWRESPTDRMISL